MSFRMPTMKSTKDYSQKIKQIRERMEKAAAVAIGAGAGLSTSAGFLLQRETLRGIFQRFHREIPFPQYGCSHTRL